ncbi:serine/threonine-protein phosphatase with EF-hands 1 [Bufo gargarizans]|uniref:serine/threonine-protein phosphatase with EF-hands 1 n=1 Tax=Bufo gargarizans TaxID=30331 RepID=UPI001CF4621F|nr:serine/threonine-protein phosphatase with EF-hands 1 [Bufo gargarizans]
MGCGTSVKTEYQGKKSEKAIKAAVLIQRWYRFYMARLEMRRRYTLNIFQSIEYAEEQAQLQLSNFFTFMIDHYAQLNEQHPGPDLISDITFNSSNKGQKNLLLYETIEVTESYDGPRLSFPLSVSDTNTLLRDFKQEKQLHARYVLQLFHEVKKFLKQMPNIVHLTTSYSKQITVCGDLHGKLDDLLLIFYKNGLPSPENSYLFNGDFVDRGKNSIEILIILFAFLLVYPNNLHLNRGNHEDPIMNLRYGFTKEVMQKYKIHAKNILHLLEDIYSLLPLGTIIDSKVLILHGGIADTTDLDFLTSIERSKYKSALRPPRLDPKRNNLIHNGNRLNIDGCKASKNSDGHIGSSSHGHTGGLPEKFRNGAILEINYLDSSIQLPDTTPELTATELKEWKQVVDILWSDPRNQYGCSPNSFRGGGCYFGPDVTQKLLDQCNLKMLIRSHECKQEGYELSHNGRVITIFSASNYYDEGSNRGAYLKLGPDLIPRFVQYQVSKCTRKLTLHQRINAAEDSALRALQEQFFAHRSDLMKAFKECDPDGTGKISINDWAKAVEAVLHLGLPWRTLRSRLARLASDGNVEYLSCFEDLQIQKSIKEVQPSLVETLYRYKTDLEIIFNIIDKDHSGLLSIEEFRQTWKLFTSHLQINIDESTIDDLAHSIDSNKDGSIDFNEFLEAFRVVHKFERKDSNRR